MKRLSEAFSVILVITAVLMLSASPGYCRGHGGGGGGHGLGGGSGGHGFGGHGFGGGFGGRGFGRGFHGGHGFYGRHGFYGGRGYYGGGWGGWGGGGWGWPDYAGGYPYYWGGLDYAGYGGGYPYDYGYYSERDKYGNLNPQLPEMEAQKADRPTSEQKYNDSRETPVLRQTWVISGETTPAFDGSLRIVVHTASGKDECQKDSAAVTYLTGDTDTKKLCLRIGEPENFTYQGKSYSLKLSGIAAQANVYRYSISISSEG